MALNIQIIRVKRIIDSLIEYIRTDYETKLGDGVVEESFLYKSLSGNSDADYDFYEQGKEIFLRNSTSPRKIKTGLMFPKNIKPTPHIHVREPSKQNGTFNSLGGGIGHDAYYEDDGSFKDMYRDTKRATYEIVVTSDNALDTVLITEVLYALFVGGQDVLSEMFTTFNFSMKELIMNNSMNTPQLYVKSINIDTQYENNLPSLVDKTAITNILFNNPEIIE